MPASCFGQLASEYIEKTLMTTFILDGADWLLFNQSNENAQSSLHQDLGEKSIAMSIGTAGFISSMEVASDMSSGAGTVHEFASPSDMAELRRLVYRFGIHDSFNTW